jgi:hypothetical protein
MEAVVQMTACAGIASGLLALAARRRPLFAWIALSPLGLALSTGGRWAALAGALTGTLVHGWAMLEQPARLRPLGFIFGGVGWALAAGIGGALLETMRSSALVPEPVALPFVLPAVALLAPLPMRIAGAPRWVHAALACTQEPWPVVIRCGWFGGDLAVSALLSVSAAAACLLCPGPSWAPRLAALLVISILATLATSARSLARTRRRLEQQPRVRIAAVVVNGAPPGKAPADGLWPLRSLEYRDVEATVARYAPHVERAAREGAKLVVLPEVAVFVAAKGVERWLDAASSWARQHEITVVAPYFDPETPTNTLAIIEPSGRRFGYDKQHPAPSFEPAPRQRQPPGPHRLERGWALSTVLCVDLDYTDLIAPMRAAGGLLVVPANDWMGFEEMHDRGAVWAAVLTEVTILRATGHGVCSARDGAGRLLGRASSLDGPTVLVVDAPLAATPRAAKASL